MSSWLVLGLGNPLSGADGFGPAVVARLRSRSAPADVTIADAGCDLFHWIGEFAGYDHVVLVDAIAVDGDADTRAGVATVSERTMTSWNVRSTGAHEMSPLHAVRLFRTLQPHTRVGREAPSLQLVGLLVTETAFAQAASDVEIAAGVAAVQALIGSGAPSQPLL
jgi:hydrogenase maturation protease